MLSDSVAVLAIFLFVPLLIGYFAVRGWRQAVRREQEQDAQRQAEQAAQEKTES